MTHFTITYKETVTRQINITNATTKEDARIIALDIISKSNEFTGNDYKITKISKINN